MIYSIEAIANYILQQTDEISGVKLQKLMYYCQACSLAWDKKPLIKEEFEAWAFGPVCPELYELHEGMSEVSASDFKLSAEDKKVTLDEEAIDTIDVVIETYGDMDGYELSQMTHLEDPWIIARGDTEPMEECHNVISREEMAKYYISQ